MSNEIKSISDLNPVGNVPETPIEQPTETAPIVIEDKTEITSEVASNAIYHEDLPYVEPDKDTSYGTGMDFGPSINRRREFLAEKVNKIKEEIEDEKLENEIAEDSEIEDDINENYNFNDDIDDSDNAAAETPVRSNNVSNTTISTPKKQESEPKTLELKIDTPIKPASKDDMPSQSDMFIDDEDFDDLDDDSQDQYTEKELAALRSSIAEKIKGVESNFDISGFTVVKEAISVNTAIAYDESKEKLFDWPLMSAGKSISMKSFSGAEIDALNGGNSRSRFNNLKDIYREFYNHISDAGKPDFEKWLKVTSFLDIPHIYMAAYNASFNGSNYIPFTCSKEKCNHIFLSDNISIRENMVKFKDDAAKLKFNEILDNGITESSCLYETRRVAVSDRYVFEFREPSIYNTIFENAVLDQKFIDKYQRLLSLMVYIDSIYMIQDKKLIPIAVKEDPSNLVKSTKYKISTYAKIISRLSSDSYNKIMSIISSINELGDEVTYQLPEVVCPKCSTTISAEEKDSTDLLFSRHQLALIANS